MIRTSMNVIPLIQCLQIYLEVLTFIENVEKKGKSRKLVKIISLVNILAIVCQVAISIFDSEHEFKLHNLIQTLRDYQYVNSTFVIICIKSNSHRKIC